MFIKSHFLDTQLYQYYQKMFLRESPLLANLRELTQTLPGANMQITPEQGQFMRQLVRWIRAEKILELGTYTGYSTLCIALGLPETGQLVTCDLEGPWLSTARDFWRQASVDHKIELKIGPAQQTMENLIQNGEAGTFDFAFIDADKGNYPLYYEQCLKLIRSGGFIAIDNVFWGGQVVDSTATDPSTQGIIKINQILKEDKRVDLCCLPIGDGLALVQKLM
jgi:predicted O-methyltransferase YrrM